VQYDAVAQHVSAKCACAPPVPGVIFALGSTTRRGQDGDPGMITDNDTFGPERDAPLSQDHQGFKSTHLRFPAALATVTAPTCRPATFRASDQRRPAFWGTRSAYTSICECPSVATDFDSRVRLRSVYHAGRRGYDPTLLRLFTQFRGPFSGFQTRWGACQIRA
jgi:hypothetical protein